MEAGIKRFLLPFLSKPGCYFPVFIQLSKGGLENTNWGVGGWGGTLQKKLAEERNVSFTLAFLVLSVSQVTHIQGFYTIVPQAQRPSPRQNTASEDQHAEGLVQSQAWPSTSMLSLFSPACWELCMGKRNRHEEVSRPV